MIIRIHIKSAIVCVFVAMPDRIMYENINSMANEEKMQTRKGYDLSRPPFLYNP